MPLADRLRPDSLEELCGQAHLLGAGQPLRRALEDGQLHSMVLWGPPGSGKTTIAQLLSRNAGAEFIALSAVLGGVKDIREAVAAAEQAKCAGRATAVFVDEVHRFNKAQQDAFLPHIENGTITFIGATTENPAFELNNALLSRVRVYALEPLDVDALDAVIARALETVNETRAVNMAPALRRRLAEVADGDARRALNLLELALDLLDGEDLDETVMKRAVEGAEVRRFDKGQDDFYDQISALHKSVRGSNPDAALYWFARLLDGGCDPTYVARRVLRIASEDIGLADPRALGIAVDAWEAWRRLGPPEGELAIAQALVYCATAPKSNASYAALNRAVEDVRTTRNDPVPLHLRNAVTPLMKGMGYGRDYKYSHDYEGHFAPMENLPERLRGRRYYTPGDQGYEAEVAQRLERWWRRKSKKGK